MSMMRNIIEKIFCLFAVFCTALTDDCQSKDFGNGGTVCVCNTNCDFIAPVERVDFPNVLTFTSNLAGLRFSKSEGSFSTRQTGAFYNIFVNPSRTYQTIVGFGGSFTDASGINIKSLSEEVQQNLLKSYFGPEGIEFTVARVPIGASDFSTRIYTYDDSSIEDPQLTEFKLAQEDLDNKIPCIKRSMELANNDLKLIGSAWTCPKWMKWFDPFGYLREDMYQPWANYYLKFLDEYKENDINFWGITTGNEPTVDFDLGPFLKFPGPALSRWIADHFGPTIRDSNYTDIKILTLDDQKTRLPFFTDEVFADPAARQYVDGLAVHWHSEDIISPIALEFTHQRYPEKFLIETEASLVGVPEVLLGSWGRGEEYAIAILEDLRHWVVGWIDVNLALNEQGGPNIHSKFVDSLIIVNATSNEFYKQPMYYALGHFSKFITPGSKMIDVSQFDESVRTIGFKRPDGGILINFINLRSTDVDITLVDKKKGETNLHLTKHSFTSILYW